MTYCIYQIDDKSNEKIIEVLKSESEFLSTIKKTIPTNLQIKSLDCLSESDISSNDCFGEGYYLLINHKLIKLVHKFETINKGYLYTSSSTDINVLFIWKLLPFETEHYKPTIHNDISGSMLDSLIFSESDKQNKYSENLNNNSEINSRDFEKPKSKSKYSNVNTNNYISCAFDTDSDINSFSERMNDVIGELESAIKNNKNNKNNNQNDSDNCFVTGDCDTESMILSDRIGKHKIINNTPQFNKFSLNDLSDYPAISIIGKRGTGKSWLVRDIINNLIQTNKLSSIENVLIINLTEKYTPFYEHAFPQAKILSEFNENAIEKYLENISNLNGDELNNFSGSIVLDNCVASKNLFNNEMIRELFFNSRLNHITFIITMPNGMQIPPELRCNLDYIFLFNDDFYTNQKTLYDRYCGMFPSFDSFRNCFLQLTNDHNCMVVINNKTASSILKKIKTYKAQSFYEPNHNYNANIKCIMDNNENKDNSKELQFNEFDLSTLCAHPSICIIAKRGSGKSWIVMNILDHMSKSKCPSKFMENTLIISKTEQMNTFYKHIFPQATILFDYNKNDIQRYFTKINNLTENEFNEYSGSVVFDDCLSSKGNWMKDPEIRELFYNSRHYKTTFIVTMQFPLGIAPELRTNFDYIFLLYEDFNSNQKKIYNQYAGMFPTFNLFIKYFLQLTDDFGSMVINNRGARGTILNKVFSFKAKSIKQ